MTDTCIDAFKNLNIANDNNALKLSPCCISPAKQTQTIDFHNNDYLQKVRDSWTQRKFPDECRVCKEQEAVGRISRRQGSNQWYIDNQLDNTEVELVRLDYWVGDLCNLACAICSPGSSSVWKQELGLPQQDKKTMINKFWKQIDLTKLRYVHFNGGEPLLSKEHIEFLKEIPNKNQVHINYNTNATVLPSKMLLELWEQFRLVQVDFSIDDIGARFEYQRYPAKWHEVTNNLQWYVDHAPHNCMFAVNTTVSILNQANIANLSEWLQKNFSVSRFTDPIDHRLQSTITGQLLMTNSPQNMRKYLDSIDSRRGTNWRQTFPELAGFLD